jgi:nucleoside-diphosphate-sugar epimerase
MKALVTGATGFIGSHLVDLLLKNGHHVRCLVRDPEKAKSLGLWAEIVCGNLGDQDSLDKACAGIDWVFHAAAKVSDWGPWEEFYADTVLGTRRMLQTAARGRMKHFVQISSVDVYDRKHLGSHLPPANEDTPQVHDRWPYFYARAKMLAERGIVELSAQGVMPVTTIRPGTVYGPGDRTIMPKLIDYLRNKPVLVKNFDPVIGLIHVDDLAELCLKAAQNPSSAGQAYNASSDEDVRLSTLSEAICDHLGIERPKRRIPFWLAKLIVKLSESYAKLTHSEPLMSQGALEFLTLDQRFDISKAQRELGWSPKVRFAQGIREAIESVHITETTLPRISRITRK